MLDGVTLGQATALTFTQRATSSLLGLQLCLLGALGARGDRQDTHSMQADVKSSCKGLARSKPRGLESPKSQFE